MKPAKLQSFTFRILLLTTCFVVMMAFTQEAHAQTSKGATHFEVGVKAKDANNIPLAFKEL